MKHTSRMMGKAVAAVAACMVGLWAQAQPTAPTEPPEPKEPTSGCERMAATVCLSGLPDDMAKKLARNGPALRSVLAWLALIEGRYQPGESPGQVSEARRDEVLGQFWREAFGGKLEAGPLSLDRMERLLQAVAAANISQRGEDAWLLVCRLETAWPLARTRAPATRPCVSLRMEGSGLLALEFGDFAAKREDWAPGPAPWLARSEQQVALSLANGRTVREGPRHALPLADLPYEAEDWGVPPARALRADQVHAPTPAEIPGARVIGTVALKAMLDAAKPPLVIDVVAVKWRRTLPGAFQLPNGGMLAIEGRNGQQAGEINETLRSRLSIVLEQETGGDRSKPVVFLCVGVDCWLSYNAALRAVGEGYANVLWYRGGTAAWRGAGLPLEFPRRIQFPGGPKDWEGE